MFIISSARACITFKLKLNICVWWSAVGTTTAVVSQNRLDFICSVVVRLDRAAGVIISAIFRFGKRKFSPKHPFISCHVLVVVLLLLDDDEDDDDELEESLSSDSVPA